MIKPVNLYALSRVREENEFNRINQLLSQNKNLHNAKDYEIESLRILVDAMFSHDLTIELLDGFYFSYKIPQIGKEFDLLKFSEEFCLNIELKSESVSETKIKNQLVKNRYYLNHLGKELLLFTVITDSLTCYKLVDDDLIKTDLEEIVQAIKKMSVFISSIDEMFRVSDFLVSPLNAPDKFIKGEYFLTNDQDRIKHELLSKIRTEKAFFHLTGKPGTGKTLLLYDIARSLSKTDSVLIIHCGKLADGQKILSKEIENIEIITAGSLKYNKISPDEYKYIFVDEAHRIRKDNFDYIRKLVELHNLTCVFSTDPGQVLSSKEINADIVGAIRSIPLIVEYNLTERIRTNEELHSFVLQLFNLKHKPHIPVNYSNIYLNYANNADEAKLLLKYYRSKDFVFINYSKSNINYSPYSRYSEDFDTHHVIGQEFDNVVMLMDSSFHYDATEHLRGYEHPTPDYLYTQLLYQGVTRTREKLALIVVDNPELFEKIVSIVS